MIRIHFSVSDVARTRLADAPSPLAVTTLSMIYLVRRPEAAPPGSWRRAVRDGLRAAERSRPWFAALACTPDGPVPGFLVQGPERGHTLESELERLRCTPRGTLRADLEHVADRRGLPPWLRGLADGDRAALDALAGSVRDYHRLAVAPHWSDLRTRLNADLAIRSRQLREGGVEQVLGSLHPRMHWRPPVLEVDSPDELDYRLDGRGLLLAPAAFVSYVPCDPGQEQPTLHYQVGPVHSPQPPPAAPHGPFPALAALLGHGRATVLEVIAGGVSTSLLAERTGLSPATVSEHASVLRRAGLVATHPAGRARHHTLTPLGAELLHSAAHGLADGPRP